MSINDTNKETHMDREQEMGNRAMGTGQANGQVLARVRMF